MPPMQESARQSCVGHMLKRTGDDYAKCIRGETKEHARWEGVPKQIRPSSLERKMHRPFAP